MTLLDFEIKSFQETHRDAVDRLMPPFARVHPHSDDVRAAS